MLSTMTVKIVSLKKALTNGGTAVFNGTLEFSNYSKNGETKTELSYEARSTAAVALIHAKVDSSGIAIGYVDTVDKVPVFKINSFVPTNLPVTAEVTENLTHSFS